MVWSVISCSGLEDRFQYPKKSFRGGTLWIWYLIHGKLNLFLHMCFSDDTYVVCTDYRWITVVCSRTDYVYTWYIHVYIYIFVHTILYIYRYDLPVEIPWCPACFFQELDENFLVASWTSNFFPFHEIIYSAKKEKLHPGRLKWNQRIHPWKRKIIFQIIIFRFHVNLPECIQNDTVDEVLIQRSTWGPCLQGSFFFGLPPMKGPHSPTAESFWFCW